MQRRNIVDFRRQARTGLGSGGASAPVVPGPLEDIETASGATARCAVWAGRISGEYTGPVVRIVRASDSTETDIYGGGATADGSIDEAAITAFCTGTNGFVVTWYDQSGNGNHLTQATSTRRPKIYDSVTGIQKDGDVVVLRFVATNPADQLFRLDNSGFGSNPGITTFFAGTVTDTAAGRIVTRVGGVTRAWTVGLHTDDTLVCSNSVGSPVGNSYRRFTAATSSSDFSWYSVNNAAYAYPGNTSLFRQNGAVLTQAEGVGAVSGTLTGAYTGVGTGESQLAGTAYDGTLAGVIHFDGVIQGAGLEALATFGDALVEAAEGAAPAPADLTLDQWYFVVSGQSNADQLAVPGTVPVSYGDSWVKVAQSGSVLDYWCTGGAGFTLLVNQILALDPGMRIVLWFIQGEADLNGTSAPTYGARRIQMHTDLEAATGRTIYCVESLIHDDIVTGGAFEDDLNVQKELYADAFPDRVVTSDPTPHGALVDGVHWDAALKAAMPEVARALARATW